MSDVGKGDFKILCACTYVLWNVYTVELPCGETFPDINLCSAKVLL